MMVRVPNAGSVGVVKDLSQHELPVNAWSDASNIRFLDGYASQFLGHSQVYGTPSATPQHVLPLNIGAGRYWIYATAAKTYVVTVTGGAAVHTDITHATPRTGVSNQWTSTSLSGIPIFNVGDTSKIPMSWDLDITHKFVDLANWPASTYCKSLRTFKNILIALNVTKSTTNYPYMVKFSHPADPGAVPASWDITDATKDAGEFDLAEGGDYIIDGLQLRDYFMVYKENSVWRLAYTGGQFVLQGQKVLGVSGAMNRNCIVEVDGWHFVLTGSDIVVHDGQAATSVLDKQARRALFQDMDVSYNSLAFVFKNPFLNEVYVCYVSIGGTVPNKALVWNYKDKTVSYRSLPNINHAAYGAIDNTLTGTWASDSDPWASDVTAWDGPDFMPQTTRVLMASNDTKLFMLDSTASFDGVAPVSYLERRGLGFDDDEHIKMIKSVRARIKGNNGQTVMVKIGGHDTDPYADPSYDVTMTHTIGDTLSCDGIVAYRYPAIRFESGTAYQWRLDSYDMDMDILGMYG